MFIYFVCYFLFYFLCYHVVISTVVCMSHVLRHDGRPTARNLDGRMPGEPARVQCCVYGVTKYDDCCTQAHL